MPPFYGLESGETSAAGIAPERYGCYRRPCLNGFTPAHVGKLENGGAEVLRTSSTAFFLVYTILPEQCESLGTLYGLLPLISFCTSIIP